MLTDEIKGWSNLSLAEKAKIIQEAVSHGVYNLKDIRASYRDFMNTEGEDSIGSTYTPSTSINEYAYGGHMFNRGGKVLDTNQLGIQAVQFFMDKGLTREQAAGLVGNLIRESRLDHRVRNRNGGAFGIGQWLGARQKALFRRYGNNPSFEDQLEYIWHELNTTHKNGLKHLKASKTVDEAAASAFGYYEFSAGPEGAIAAMDRHGRKGTGRTSFNQGITFAHDIYGQHQRANNQRADIKFIAPELESPKSDEYIPIPPNPTDYGTPVDYSTPTKPVTVEALSAPVESQQNGWELLKFIQGLTAPQQTVQPTDDSNIVAEASTPFVVAVPSASNTILTPSWFADGGQMYKVQKGDTLSAIAKKNGLSLEELLKLNPQIEDANKIWVGDTINTDVTKTIEAPQSGIPFRLAEAPLPSQQFSLFGNYVNPSSTPIGNRREVNIKEEWGREDALAGDNLAIIQAAPHTSNYVVIDKANGSLNVFDKDNSLLYQMPVNTGVSGNDYNTITYTEGGKLINNAGNNSTPAGITYISGVGQYHGLPSFTRSRSLSPNSKGEDDNIASSIHYAKLDKSNSRKSNGCVRADGKDLKALQNFIAKGTPVYTLPENNTSRFTLRNNKLSFVADDPYGIDVFKAKPREEYKTQKAYENALKKEAESRKKFAKEHPDMDFDEAYKKRFWDDYNVYTDKSYSPLRIVDDEAINNADSDSDYYQNRHRYANSLSSNKEMLQKDFGISSDTYNHIANIALGIAEQETKFGTAFSYKAKQVAGESGVNAAKAIKEFFGGSVSPVNSQGITQIKLDSDNEATQEKYKKYGITKDSVKTPEGSALATMVRLLTMYKDEVVGRKFTAHDGSRISPYDALVYKWNGKNRRLTSGKADPKNNLYIQHIAESTKGFSFYEDRDVDAASQTYPVDRQQVLFAYNPNNTYLGNQWFAEGGPLKGSYSDWKKAIAEHNGIHVDGDNTYDYEGYYNKYPAQAWAMLSDDPEAHFTDEFKTVNHPSFSNQSKYSGIVDARFNPEGIIGGNWSEDGKRYTLSEDQARHRWDIGNTMDYFGSAENNGVQGFYPDGRHWTTADGDMWGGTLPAVTVTPKKKANGGYLFDEGGPLNPEDGTELPEVEVYPNYLDLTTYYPVASKYPLSGHSKLQVTSHNGYITEKDKIDRRSDDAGYNFVTNNCADATREALEGLSGIRMNPYFFTTPGDVQDFFEKEFPHYVLRDRNGARTLRTTIPSVQVPIVRQLAEKQREANRERNRKRIQEKIAENQKTWQNTHSHAEGGHLFLIGGNTDGWDDFKNSTFGNILHSVPIVGNVMDGVDFFKHPSLRNYAKGVIGSIIPGGTALIDGTKQAKQVFSNLSGKGAKDTEEPHSDVELEYDDEFGYGYYDPMDPPTGLKHDYEKKYGKREAKRHFGQGLEAFPEREHHNTSPTAERSEQAENEMRNTLNLRHKGLFGRDIPISNREWDMPFIPSKAIVVNGNVISTNQLDSLAKYWGWHNAYPQLSYGHSGLAKTTRTLNKNEMLGLANQESTFGAQPVFNMGMEHNGGNGGFTSRELGNANYLKAFGSIPAEYYMRDFHYNNANVPRSTPPFLDAFQYYGQGDYNRGDPNHRRDVNAAGASAWKAPSILQWWQDSGRIWADRGREQGEQQKKRDEEAKKNVKK